MSKKIITLLLVAVLVISGCSKSEDKPADTNNTVTAAATPEADKEPTAEVKPETDPVEDKSVNTEDGQDPIADTDGTDQSGTALSMSVNSSDGKLSIKRMATKGRSMGEAGTWTIFVYLCGSDLDSNEKGFATGDLAQMLQAETSDKVRFVIQTGGTKDWANELVNANAGGRWVVQNNDIELADSVELGNMGDPAFLADFLNWGIQNFPAEKMGVILWDHGCGSINGACIDDINDCDTLTLQELNTAFASVYSNMTDKFEFIGFDCCIMGSSELANILTTYARYFYGSQESEPGTGWDYTTIGNFLTENSSADGAELGKVVTDSFYAECEAIDKQNGCTFTIVDLNKFDEFAIAFNDFCKELYDNSQTNFSGIVRGVNSADNFGGNNKAEGYTNMVDIGGIIENCSDYADGSAALKALKDCIVYNKNGSNHANASGLSIYYPLQVRGSNEIGIFSGICFSPYYLSLVDRVARGYSEEEYSNSKLFDTEGNWVNEDCESEDIDEEYFTYEDDGNESQLITFAIEPQTDMEEGYYGFQLDEQGREYATGVEAFIYMYLDEETTVELGETYDVNADWEQGIFIDNFDGKWLALPNGMPLATYVADVSEDAIIYASPIQLNGERTNLRIRQEADGTYLEGVWDGIDENGAPSRDIRQLKAGDKIVAVYYLLTDNDEDVEVPAEDAEYEWQEDDCLIFDFLPAAEYFYSFIIEDVYGDMFFTDMTLISIDDEGNIDFIDPALLDDEEE